MKSILIAEDEAPIREGLVDLLEGEGYEVRSASDGEEALAMYYQQHPDLLLLDVMMPNKSGYDVAREIRQRDSRTLILMLTAKGQELDKVVGLELGADDYVVKPFGVSELLARIRSHLRRLVAVNESVVKDLPVKKKADEFRFGFWTVHPRLLKIKKEGGSCELTVRELNLLNFFAEHEGEVLDRNRLLNEIWGMEYIGTTRTLDQHIAKLRKKVEENSEEPRFIRTIHGVGYQYLA